MKIKKGDKVRVISGSDKGKEGTVQKVFAKTNKVVVDGVNKHKRNKKPTQANPEGTVVEIFVPIDASNVMVIDPKTKKPTRIGYKVENGKKVRVAKKGGNIIG